MRSGNVAVIVADFKVCVERPKMAEFWLCPVSSSRAEI
jgi:hypothetical protein